MNKIELLFLELFNAFVRQTNIKNNGISLKREDWGKLRYVAAYHQVTPMIFEEACKLENYCQAPLEMMLSWKHETMMDVVTQTRMTDEFLRLYQEMDAHGIRPLVVKGIVCRQLYSKPDYRRSGDEDLLIRREDFWKVNDFLIAKGFQRTETMDDLKSRIHNIHEVGYRNMQNGLYLELHMSLFPEESGAYGHFNDMFMDVHQHSVSVDVQGLPIDTLDYSDHFLYLVCHSAKHFIHSGFGVRQVMDMILFAENYGSCMDWNKILQKAKHNHIDIFMMNLLDIGVRYFDFDVKKASCPTDKMRLDGTLDSTALLKDLLDGGVFGSSTDERLHSSNMTVNAADRRSSKGGLLAALFPENAYMEKKYTYVKNHAWLLPVGWANRIGDHLMHKGNVDNKAIVSVGNQRIELLRKYGMLEK